MYRKKTMNCGITYDRKGIPKIEFVVEQYFDDFKNAFNDYCNRIQKEPDLVNRFVEALKSIDSPLPRSYNI